MESNSKTVRNSSRFFLVTLFILIMATLYVADNIYLFYSIKSTFPLFKDKTYLRMLQIIFWSFAVIYPTGEITRHLWRKYNILLNIGVFWLGFMGIFSSFYVLGDIAICIFNSPQEKKIGAFSLSLIIFIISLKELFLPVKIKKVKIVSPKIKNETKIIQVSDLHLGYLKSERWLKKIVNSILRMEGELILLTGDLIDCNYRCIKKYITILRELGESKNVLIIPGNHDYFSEFKIFKRVCEETNFTLLDNKCKSEKDINICGVHDPTGRFFGFNRNMGKVLSSISSEKFNILLSHTPVKEKSGNFDLILSGHTHAGQIPPMELLVFLVYWDPWGLKKYGNTIHYTTSGTGTWGPPMRFLSRSEIIIFELIPQKGKIEDNG